MGHPGIGQMDSSMKQMRSRNTCHLGFRSLIAMRGGRRPNRDRSLQSHLSQHPSSNPRFFMGGNKPIVPLQMPVFPRGSAGLKPAAANAVGGGGSGAGRPYPGSAAKRPGGRQGPDGGHRPALDDTCPRRLDRGVGSGYGARHERRNALSPSSPPGRGIVSPPRQAGFDLEALGGIRIFRARRLGRRMAPPSPMPAQPADGHGPDGADPQPRPPAWSAPEQPNDRLGRTTNDAGDRNDRRTK